MENIIKKYWNCPQKPKGKTVDLRLAVLTEPGSPLPILWAAGVKAMGTAVIFQKKTTESSPLYFGTFLKYYNK